MNKKEFKTLDEQLGIFKSKGLTINDEEEARNILLKENYFFINGYRRVLMVSSKEQQLALRKDHDPVTSLTNELYAIFMFDRELRNILFKNLLIIENNIKSIISYKLSVKYGYKEKNYLKESNFTTDNKDKRRVSDVINKMKRQIRVNSQNHSATLHYITNYGYIPLWVLVKVLSFGLINELYGILKPEDQKEIADLYGIEMEDMEIYLSLLANYRNLCAHEDIVFDHRTQKYISNTKYHNELKIKQDEFGEYVKGKNDIFALIIILKQMLTKDEFMHMMDEINLKLQDLTWQIKSVKINKIYDTLGFPENYMDLINIE